MLPWATYPHNGRQVAAASARRSNVTVGNNLLPNTQWQIFTAFGAARKMGAEGVGTAKSIEVDDCINGALGSSTVHCTTTNTQELKVGDIVTFTAPAHPAMTICSLPVIALNKDTNFTVKLPLGLTVSYGATCTAVPITAGAAASIGPALSWRGNVVGHKGNGYGPDGWNKDPRLMIWRDDWADNNHPGSTYQLGVKKSTAKTERLWVPVPARDLPKYLGRQIVFGAWCYQKFNGGSGAWSVYIDCDGAGGSGGYSAPTTTAAYEWQEVSATIPKDATYLHIGLQFKGKQGDTFYVSQPMADYGDSLGTGNYRQPANEVLIPVVNMSPKTYFIRTLTMPSWADNVPGASPEFKTYGFGFCPYAETNGAIAPTVKKLFMQMEGVCDTARQALTLRNQLLTPHLYSLRFYSKVGGIMETMAGELTLDDNGNGWVASNTASSIWKNVTFEIHGYLLS
jgi:hypothetical protein